MYIFKKKRKRRERVKENSQTFGDYSTYNTKVPYTHTDTKNKSIFFYNNSSISTTFKKKKIIKMPFIEG